MPKVKNMKDRSGLTRGLKLYISLPEAEGVFGGGKWKLLEAVRQTGSLQAAAQLLGRSYRKAWGDIKRAEEGLGRLLVIRSRGGVSRGATRLTDFGERLIDAWQCYHSVVSADADRAFDCHIRPLLEEESRGETD